MVNNSWTLRRYCYNIHILIYCSVLNSSSFWIFLLTAWSYLMSSTIIPISIVVVRFQGRKSMYHWWFHYFCYTVNDTVVILCTQFGVRTVKLCTGCTFDIHRVLQSSLTYLSRWVKWTYKISTDMKSCIIGSDKIHKTRPEIFTTNSTRE